jgi:thymidylate synthase
MARDAGLEPGEFIHTFGDAHLYANHFDQAREQLSRAPRPLPRLAMAEGKTDLFSWNYEDFTVLGYEPHPHIKAPVAV